MDNKTYLDQIAVKGKSNGTGGFSKKKSIISPAIIKLILVGLIIIATLLGVLSVIKKSSKADYSSFETLYLRAQNLGSKSSPLYTYAPKVKSADVRTQTETLIYVLNKLNSSLGSQIQNEGADLSDISPEVTNQETLLASEYITALQDSLYVGTLDRVYVQKTYYQITMLSAAIDDVMNKATSADFVNNLRNIKSELDIVEEKFLNFTTIY